jgi:hypothetical protein
VPIVNQNLLKNLLNTRPKLNHWRALDYRRLPPPVCADDCGLLNPLRSALSLPASPTALNSPARMRHDFLVHLSNSLSAFANCRELAPKKKGPVSMAPQLHTTLVIPQACLIRVLSICSLTDSKIANLPRGGDAKP